MFAKESHAIPAEFSAAKRACTLRITRNVTSDDLEGMARLRNDNFYTDPCDPRYASGGVHRQLDVAAMARIHAADPTSHFVLVHDAAEDNHLIACARFTFIEPDSGAFDKKVHEPLPSVTQGRAVLNHIIIVDRNWRGQNVNVNGTTVKISDAIFAERAAFARDRGCSVAYCDIAVSPVANLASLRNMTRCGMVELGEAEPVQRNGLSVRFKRYGMGLRR